MTAHALPLIEVFVKGTPRMPQDPLSSMRLALRPHLCGARHTDSDIETIIEQCALTLGIARAFPKGVTASDLRNATKVVMLSLNRVWRQTEFERFMCILLDGGHVRLGKNMELVPA